MSNGSVLWQFFTRLDRFYAKCNMCKKTISYKTTTTNLKRHMMRKHRTAQFLRCMNLVHRQTQDRIAQRQRKQDPQNLCDPYESVVLYDEKPQVLAQSSESTNVIVERIEENEHSKHGYVDSEPVSDIEYPFDDGQCDTMESRPWTPVRFNGQRSPSKSKKDNLVEVCNKLVKTLQAREARDERLFTQQQSVIAKLDQTLLLVTQVLVKLNEKFDKL
ncbi:uncharacterized protein [Eurosta solidaginis]|uniref:uncharacterized protein n=1 Tax=Eurosta solidaginis TaxID=178769 RepID=UPI0035309252